MAIAYDAGANGSANPGTSFTFAHTCTGSDRLLMVGITVNKTTDIVTSVTYNGVAMTRLSAVQAATTNFYVYSYYLFAPATGTNNVGVNFTGSEAVFATSDSYTGVAQIGVLDSSASGTDAAGNYSATTTVVDAGCWLWSFSRSNNSTSGITAGASTTIRRDGSGGGGFSKSADSNGTVSTGAQSLNFTVSPGGETGWVIASMTPIRIVAAAGAFTLTGVDATMTRNVPLVAAAGSFVLTGVAASLRVIGWVNRSRPTSTWTDVNRSDQ